MSLEKVHIKSGNQLYSLISDWAIENNVETNIIEEGVNELELDGVLFLTLNQELSAGNGAIFKAFDKKNVPMRKIDLNGTLQASITGFGLWVDSNKCKEIAIVLDELVLDAEKLSSFLGQVGPK